MALISCSECGKEISDKAQSCPNCGNPINMRIEEYVCCPKCRSKELHVDKKGFSGGKALAGAVLTGGIGLLAGTLGSKDIQMTCLKCGNKFKAGEALVEGGNDSAPIPYESEIAAVIKNDGLMAAIKYCKEKTGLDLAECKKRVDEIAAKHSINAKSGSGCMVALLMLIVVPIILYAML